MYSWSLQTKIQECQGIIISSKHTYTILVRLDNNFSQQSSPAKIIRNKLQFKTNILLEFTSSTEHLPSNNLQILLIKNQIKSNGYKQDNKNDQQIIGIASIKLTYPLTKQLQKINIYDFDRSFQKRSTIKLSLGLNQQKIDKQEQEDNYVLQIQQKGQPWLSLLQLQIQKNKQYQKHLSIIYQQLNNSIINTSNVSNTNPVTNDKLIRKSNSNKSKDKSQYQLQKQRDQLYKLSQNLYRQLKECSQQRDQLFKQLRQKQISYNSLRQQLQFLKSRLEQYQNSRDQNDILVSQLEYYKNQSRTMNLSLQKKQKQLIEMERKVKESLTAVQNFRKQASQARNELYNKQFQHSISRGSKYLDPIQIIEQLSYQIRNRKLDPIVILEPLKCNKIQLDNFYKIIQKQITIMITQLISKVPSQKVLLIKKKSDILRKIEELILVNSIS